MENSFGEAIAITQNILATASKRFTAYSPRVVIGINARDLSTFAIDRSTQLDLVAQAPRDRVVIAESAIESRAQAAAAVA